MSHLVKGIIIFGLIGIGVLFIIFRYSSDLTDQKFSRHEVISRMEEKGIGDFKGKLLAGGDFHISEIEGKPFILNFWATWCEPCLEEFPSMMELLRKFPDDFYMVAVSGDKEKKDLEVFLDAFGSRNQKNLINIWDPEMKMAPQYGTEILPESYIFDKNHKLARKVIGSIDWVSEDALGYFRERLGLELKESKDE